jgi:hypothetical protein
MSQNNLVQPVAAAATSQVKLCPYNEEETQNFASKISLYFENRGCDLVGVVVVKLTQAIAMAVKRIEVWAGRRATFGTGIAAPFVTLLSICWSWALTSLFHGGRDREVVASSSVPQGVRGFHNNHGCLVVSCANFLPHGRW